MQLGQIAHDMNTFKCCVNVFGAGFMDNRSVEQHLGSNKDNDNNDLSAYVRPDYTPKPLSITKRWWWMAASYNGDKCYIKYGWNSVNMLKYDRYKGPVCNT